MHTAHPGTAQACVQARRRCDFAMPHFYFHVVNGSGTTRDEEGVDLPDLEAARREALSGIRSILREEILDGRLDFGGTVHIADNHDHVLLDVPFKMAVQILNMDHGR